MSAQDFGGPWTLIKLNIVKQYLKTYTTALSKQNFELVYIDTYAGTGTVKISPTKGAKKKIEHTMDLGLPDPNNLILTEASKPTTHPGSAKIALDLEPPFDRYIFIEKSTQRANELSELCSQYEHRNTTILTQDANLEITNVLKPFDWQSTRSVLFLDPFGMETGWPTLERIANTQAIDVWYLFPLSGLFRQAAIDLHKVDEGKAKALTHLLGTDEWKNIFYQGVQPGLLMPENPGDYHQPKNRTASYKDMMRFVRTRMETIFSYVAPEAILTNPSNNAPLFALMFAISNRSQKAINLATKFSTHILKMPR